MSRVKSCEVKRSARRLLEHSVWLRLESYFGSRACGGKHFLYLINFARGGMMRRSCAWNWLAWQNPADSPAVVMEQCGRTLEPGRHSGNARWERIAAVKDAAEASR